MAKKPSQVKARIWALLVYPESAPEGWRERLKQSGVQGFISPLHDKDVKEETEEEKKKHWHVGLVFSGPTSLAAVSEISKQLNGPAPQRARDVKGLYDYCSHKNNPEKYQYDEAEIECFNGFDISKYVTSKSTGERLQLRRAINALIKKENICEYCELIDRLEEIDDVDMLEVAMSSTIHFNTLLTSRRFRASQVVSQVTQLDVKAIRKIVNEELKNGIQD
ncbi:replication protein [Campylobacter concisus]|uniref:replication protein n=2 Tax=Campylobacter concisus TaxID=199 RepID=UPI000CD92F9D|nr:replication protein [Campylobacter concisus]